MKKKYPRPMKFVQSKSRWWKNKKALDDACTAPKSGYVYVFSLGFGNLYKVGMTTDVQRRLKDLQASNPQLANSLKQYADKEAQEEKEEKK